MFPLIAFKMGSLKFLFASVLLCTAHCATFTISWAWSNSDSTLTLTGSSGLTLTCTLTIPTGDKFLTEATVCTQTDYYAAYKALTATTGMFAVMDKTNGKVNGAAHVTVGTDS